MASRVSQILWGPSLENILAFGYPLRSLVMDREPRQDFATAQAAAGGAEDGWATGFDYTMDCEATFVRSEEHTSELQSLTNLVCRLLLEKKKTLNWHLD